MGEGKGKVVAAIIIAITLIYCANVLKEAYMNKGIPQNHAVNASLNTDFSSLERIVQNQGKEVFTLSEAAKYLGFKEDYFRELFYAGKLDSLPYVTIAGTAIFSKKSLNEWIENASKSHVNIQPN